MKRKSQKLTYICLQEFRIFSSLFRTFVLLVKSLFACLLLVQSIVSSAADITVDSQDQLEISRIKSAYLYNFLKYVQFNHQEQALILEEYSVCVLGRDPFGSALDAMSGRTAKGVTVDVKRVANISEAKHCHIVYISKSEKKNLSTIFKTLSHQSILTVSDIEDFVQDGGIIGFTGENKKIGIEINLTNARRSNIRISALLLEIARITD